MMNIEVKKTQDLTNVEKQQIVELFNHVFFKNESTEGFFKKYYWTASGGSYHSIMKINGSVVGFYSVIPYSYIFFEKHLIFGLSVDTMIHENFRGNPYEFKKMAVAIYEKLIQDGISFVFGFPNENIFLVRRKILKWKDIGLIDYYILPIKLGKIKPSLNFFNPVSKAISYLIIYFTRTNSKIFNKDIGPNILMSENCSNFFISNRYAENYIIINDENGYFSYRFFLENNTPVVYILDVFPLSQERLEKAVNYIYQNLVDISAIIYVGNLNFSPRNMFKVPRKLTPKFIRMSGLILNHSEVDERVYEVSNWQVSLANFDVR
jgi:hypothetical protein